MLQSFHKTLPIYIEKILLGHAENDLDSLLLNVQLIKSTAKSLGALHLAKYCQEAEDLLVAGASLMECEGALILVVHEASTVHREVQREIDLMLNQKTLDHQI